MRGEVRALARGDGQVGIAEDGEIIHYHLLRRGNTSGEACYGVCSCDVDFDFDFGGRDGDGDGDDTGG
jgi:hypothetical protein